MQPAGKHVPETNVHSGGERGGGERGGGGTGGGGEGEGDSGGGGEGGGGEGPSQGTRGFTAPAKRKLRPLVICPESE